MSMTSQTQYNKEELKEIGLRIKNYRLLRNLSQKKLGEKMGSNANYLSRVERGLKQKLSQEEIKHIARCMNADPSFLLLESHFGQDPWGNYILEPSDKSIVEKFLMYGTLYHDILYMATEMHSDYYEPLLSLIHQHILVHASFGLSKSDCLDELLSDAYAGSIPKAIARINATFEDLKTPNKTI